MARRMKRSQDRQVFRHTAVNSKRINVNPKIYRGGIRMWMTNVLPSVSGWISMPTVKLAAKVWRSLDMELDFYEFLALELQIRLIELSGYT